MTWPRSSFLKLSTLTVLAILSFLYLNRERIILCVCGILSVQYKIIEQYIEHYLATNIWMTVIYEKDIVFNHDILFLMWDLILKIKWYSHDTTKELEISNPKHVSGAIFFINLKYTDFSSRRMEHIFVNPKWKDRHSIESMLSVHTFQAIFWHEFSRNTQSWQHWHFCTTSNVNKLETVKNLMNFKVNLHL